MTNNLPPLAPSLPPYSTGFGLFSLLFDDMQTNMTPAKCTAMDVTSMLLNLGNSSSDRHQFAVDGQHLRPLEANSGLCFSLPALFSTEEWKPLSLPCSHNDNNSYSNLQLIS